MSFAKYYVLTCYLFAAVLTVMINGQELALEGPTLDSGRNYYCLNEEIIFNCTGPGTLIRWDSPPEIVNVAFSDLQSPPRSVQINGVDATANLIQSMPTFITTLTVQGIRDINVNCSNVTEIETTSLTTSTTPPVVQNINLTILYDSDSSLQANVNWTPVTGTFDLRQYRIRVCNTSRACSNIASTTRVSVETRLSDEIEISLAVNASIFMEIVAESHCDDTGDPGMSNVVIIPPPSGAIYIASASLSVVLVALVFSLYLAIAPTV